MGVPSYHLHPRSDLSSGFNLFNTQSCSPDKGMPDKHTCMALTWKFHLIICWGKKYVHWIWEHHFQYTCLLLKHLQSAFGLQHEHGVWDRGLAPQVGTRLPRKPLKIHTVSAPAAGHSTSDNWVHLRFLPLARGIRPSISRCDSPPL